RLSPRPSNPVATFECMTVPVIPGPSSLPGPGAHRRTCRGSRCTLSSTLTWRNYAEPGLLPGAYPLRNLRLVVRMSNRTLTLLMGFVAFLILLVGVVFAVAVLGGGGDDDNAPAGPGEDRPRSSSGGFCEAKQL